MKTLMTSYPCFLMILSLAFFSSSTLADKTPLNNSIAEKDTLINRIDDDQHIILSLKIIEVTQTLAKQLSLNFATPKTIHAEDAFIWKVLPIEAENFTNSYITTETLLNWSLDFSRETGRVTILAEPNLSTLSGQKASFLSGGEFPYLKNCKQNNCHVDFRQFGIALEFLPTLLNPKRISLNAHVSISALNNIGAEVAAVASKSLREDHTSVELADGQTMSIAGLLTTEKEQKELIILVTPHLAKPLAKVSLPTGAFVEPDEVGGYLLGQEESDKLKSLANQADNNGGLRGQFGHQLK